MSDDPRSAVTGLPGMRRPIDDPALARLLVKARRSLERSGGSLDATVSLDAPTHAERRMVIGITGVHRSAGVARIAVRLSELDVHLKQVFGAGLIDTLTAAGDGPLRDRPGERRREAQARAAAIDEARDSALGGVPWFDQWLASMSADGTLTRLLRSGGSLRPVVRVLEALPADDEPMPVFAQRVLGDTKALGVASGSGTARASGAVRASGVARASGEPTVKALVLRALAAWQQLDVPSGAEGERDLWESVGVVRDDLASQVLVLNLPGRGSVVGEWLTQAAAIAMPLRLTLHQLRSAPPQFDVPEIFVTENPAVLRAALRLGAGAKPLVCTEGVPSVAVHRLFAAAPAARLRWRNDFDWPGVRMLTAALARYGDRLVPWRMSAADYLAAGADGPALGGAAAPTPWDPALAGAMSERRRAVMEESMLHVLLADLRGPSEVPAAGGSGH